MGSNLEASVKQSYHQQQNKGQPYLPQLRRRGVKPTKKFDMHAYYLKHCKKQQRGSIAQFFQPQEEEKQPIITATVADCEGLLQEGPFQIHNPEQYPYSAVGIVYSKVKNSSNLTVGTGCLIGPNLVLTCAHNCYQAKIKEWNTDIKFVPSLIEKDVPQQGYAVKKVFVPEKYIRSDANKSPKYNQGFLYDYAILLLDTQDNLQQYFGSFGYDFQWQESDDYCRMMQSTKTVDSIEVIAFQLTKNKSEIIFVRFQGSALCNSHFLIYPLHTSYGVSGAPVLVNEGGDYIIRAIHIRDVSDIIEGGSSVKHKAGLKLRYKMFEDIHDNFKNPFHHYELENKHIKPKMLNQIIESIKLNEKFSTQHALSINFTDNTLGDLGCETISEVKLQNLTHLSLWGNKITANGCLYLASARWPHLRYLNLRNNLIGEKGIEVLRATNWQYLQELDLWDCHIGDEGCKYLSKTKWYRLKSINLRNNDIENGCKYLANANWKYLHSINLRINRIRNQGCQELAKADWIHLQHLNLRNNLIDNEGCLFLSRGKWNKTITIDLMSNKEITKEGIKNLENSKIRVFWDNETKKY